MSVQIFSEAILTHDNILMANRVCLNSYVLKFSVFIYNLIKIYNPQKQKVSEGPQ
jgi:hypothetical protein